MCRGQSQMSSSNLNGPVAALDTIPDHDRATLVASVEALLDYAESCYRADSHGGQWSTPLHVLRSKGSVVNRALKKVKANTTGKVDKEVVTLVLATLPEVAPSTEVTGETHGGVDADEPRNFIHADAGAAALRGAARCLRRLGSDAGNGKTPVGRLGIMARYYASWEPKYRRWRTGNAPGANPPVPTGATETAGLPPAHLADLAVGTRARDEPPVALRTVSSVQEIRDNCRRFCQGSLSHHDRVRRISVTARYWVYDVDEDSFGPAKFVGFEGMTYAKYEKANQGPSTGDRFDEHVTQQAIGDLLKPFERSELLTERLKARLTSDVCEGVDSDKWRFASIASTRSYFALLCNPSRFDGLGAVTALPELAWTVNRMSPSVGDRILLWQAKGDKDRRGVIAIGEVTRGLETEPSPGSEAGFWREPDTDMKPRIRFRAYESPGLPIWEDASPWLGDLAVARATGGTVFTLSADEWNRVAKHAATRDVAGDRIAKRDSRGQGSGLSAAERRAVELHAQGMVEAHFLALGFVVHDVSGNHPYDLHCVRGKEERHVEVKGTTGLGEQVILTRNEVEHAQANKARMVLAIVSGIRLERTKGPPATGGGELVLWEPWDVDAGQRRAIQFRYSPA